MCDDGTTNTYLNRGVREREEFEMALEKHFHPSMCSIADWACFNVLVALLFDLLAPFFRIHLTQSTPQHSTSSAHVLNVV